MWLIKTSDRLGQLEEKVCPGPEQAHQESAARLKSENYEGVKKFKV